MKRFSGRPLRPPLNGGSLHWNCMIPTLAWTPEGVRFIDQTKLPLEESYVLASTYEQVADVVAAMVVRGAPAIAVSSAYGIVLGAMNTSAATPQEFAPEFEKICARLAGTRPTAVNLFWAIDRMKRLFARLLSSGASLAQIKEKFLAEAPQGSSARALPASSMWGLARPSLWKRLRNHSARARSPKGGAGMRRISRCHWRSLGCCRCNQWKARWTAGVAARRAMRSRAEALIRSCKFQVAGCQLRDS